jgi:hypothetical protein
MTRFTPPAAAQPLQRRGQGERQSRRSPVARLIGEALIVPGAVLFWVICMGVFG